MEREILSWADQLIQESPLPVFYQAGIDVLSLLKLLDVKFDTQNGDVLDSIDVLFRIHSLFFQTRLFVFINLHHFFSAEELKNIYASAAYRKICLLCIESKPASTLLENERLIIIDKDHCLIYNQNETDNPSGYGL